MGNQNDFDKITNVGEDADKRKLLYTIGKNVNCIAIMEVL